MTRVNARRGLCGTLHAPFIRQGYAVAADTLTSRELTSLRDEVIAAQRDRAVDRAAASPPPPTEAPQPRPATDAADEIAGAEDDHLHDLTDEVTHFFAEAEKSIAAHPAQSVIGALLVGILIGRLLGRRRGAVS